MQPSDGLRLPAGSSPPRSSVPGGELQGPLALRHCLTATSPPTPRRRPKHQSKAPSKKARQFGTLPRTNSVVNTTALTGACVVATHACERQRQCTAQSPLIGSSTRLCASSGAHTLPPPLPPPIGSQLHPSHFQSMHAMRGRPPQSWPANQPRLQAARTAGLLQLQRHGRPLASGHHPAAEVGPAVRTCRSPT